MSTADIDLRPVGLLEKLSTARQVLGVYNSVSFTAQYTLPASVDPTLALNSIFGAVLSRQIQRHPILSCYFEKEDTSSPQWRRLGSIRIKEVLQIVDCQLSQLTQKLEELHDRQWSSNGQPLWKLIVFKQPQVKGDVNSTIHVTFLFHHAIGDGLSGVAFHKTLFKELMGFDPTSQAGTPTPETFQIPSTALIEPVEKLVSLSLSPLFLFKQVLHEYGPQWLIPADEPIWAAQPTQTLEQCPLRTQIRIINIDAESVNGLLAISRRHGVTLTSVINAAIACSLAHSVPNASRFTSTTPITLRRVTGTSREEMVNQTSALVTNCTSDMLEHIRAAGADDEHKQESILTTAAHFHRAMEVELAQCPRNNLVGLLPYVTDFIEFYRKKFGKEREATWEVSNVGLVDIPQDTTPSGFKIESLTMAQGAQVLGPAFSVNGATVKGGPLVITITSQKTTVEDEILDNLAKDFANLLRLLQTKPI